MAESEPPPGRRGLRRCGVRVQVSTAWNFEVSRPHCGVPHSFKMASSRAMISDGDKYYCEWAVSIDWSGAFRMEKRSDAVVVEFDRLEVERLVREDLALAVVALQRQTAPEAP